MAMVGMAHRKSRMRLPILTTLLTACALLAGCATVPPVALSPPPNVVAGALDAYLDSDVTWGGMVIETVNFDRHSEIEVLAFPLDRHGHPQPDALDLGRFVVVRAGFLDPHVFAPGRLVTASGRVTGDRQGHLRQVPYRWPELDARQLELWTVDRRQTAPRFTFSLGVGIRR
jgi:outer membrane lipoprotein